MHLWGRNPWNRRSDRINCPPTQKTFEESWKRSISNKLVRRDATQNRHTKRCPLAMQNVIQFRSSNIRESILHKHYRHKTLYQKQGDNGERITHIIYILVSVWVKYYESMRTTNTVSRRHLLSILRYSFIHCEECSEISPTFPSTSSIVSPTSSSTECSHEVLVEVHGVTL